MKEEPVLLASWIMCPDGTMLPSFNRHDFRTHTTVDSWKRVWKSNGKDIKEEVFDSMSFEEISEKTKLVTYETRYSMTDGGTDYLRRGGKFTEMSIYSDDSFSVIRRFLCRGGRGKESKDHLTWTPLFRINNAWLETLIEYEEKRNSDNIYLEYYRKELEYRLENNIKIEE